MTDVATEGAQAPQEGTQEATSSGLDLSPVLERFDDMGSRMERMESSFAEYLQGDEPEQADEFDFASLFGDDPGQGQEADPRQQLNPEALQQLIDQRAQSLFEEKYGPLSEQVRSIQVGLDAEALTARYPDLAKQEIAGPVVAKAKELAELAGKPELATNTQLLETIYKAQMADRYAAGEVPVGGKQQFEAERAGGAGPTADDAPDIAQRIIASRQQQSSWRDLFN